MARHVIRPIPLMKSKGMTYKYSSLMTYLVGFDSLEEHGGYIWYIQGPAENIIVDAGTDVSTLPPRPVISPFTDSKPENIQSVEDGLSKVGLRPEDIDIVILTHMHEDHAQLARKYTKAKFIVQEAELKFARNPHPAQHFPYLKDPFDDINFEVIEGDKKIVDGVSVILTPGHSAGGQSVIIETAKGIAIIAGFCCIRRNFEPPAGAATPVIPPGILLDTVQAYESVLKVKELADIVIPLHDSEFLEVDRIP